MKEGFEEKVLQAEKGIRRGLEAKAARMSPSASSAPIILKGFRPAAGGRVLPSEIPGYDGLDGECAKAYEEAARRLLAGGILEKVTMDPARKGLIARLTAQRGISPSPFGRIADDESYPEWARAWAAEKKIQGGGLTPKQEDLARAVEVLGGKKKWFERDFSIACYGDSKYFAKHVRADLAKAVRKHSSEGKAGRMEGLSDGEVLAFAGIEKMPGEILVGGPLSIVHADGVFDVSDCGPFGAGVSDAMVDGASVECSGAKGVVLIENKTNYHAVLERFWRDVVVVFLAGFMSPSTRRLVGKIDRSLPESAFRLVWADIDEGGFCIAKGVMDDLPSFEPFLMGLEDMANFDLSLCRRPPDAKQQSKAVARMLPELEGTAMESAARAVALSGLTLEQEAMLGGYAERRLEEVIRGREPSAWSRKRQRAGE